jgi:hypothetical protein
MTTQVGHLMESTKHSKIPVIYILSTGRSGSTLLDLLLGLHPQIWTLGEAQMLPLELKDNLRPCGCGLPVAKCDFWLPIVSQIPLYKGTYPIEHFRPNRTGKALRYSYLPQLFVGRAFVKTLPVAEEYGRVNAAYFRVVWEAAQQRRNLPILWLVDASKDIYRLFLLMQSQHFDFRIIHLIKDPRAFVYSMTKDQPDVNSRSIRFAARWIIQNAQFSHFCSRRNMAGKVMQIRYEDLAGHPEKKLLEIGSWLGLDFAGVSYDDFRQQENHAVSGNLMRWRNSKIALDETWRSELPKPSSSLVWSLTGSFARFWGYSR